MATAKKKAAAKKTTAKNTKRAAKKTAKKPQPSLTRTVNMGPLRGDNSFPPDNKPMSKDRSRAPAKKAHGSPANDSTRGPGGQGLQGGKKGQKGGGKDD